MGLIGRGRGRGRGTACCSAVRYGRLFHIRPILPIRSTKYCGQDSTGRTRRAISSRLSSLNFGELAGLITGIMPLRR